MRHEKVPPQQRAACRMAVGATPRSDPMVYHSHTPQRSNSRCGALFMWDYAQLPDTHAHHYAINARVKISGSDTVELL